MKQNKKLTLLIFLIYTSHFFSQTPNNFHFLNNGTLKVGIDKERGGAIGYISKSTDTRNIVNIRDDGRYIQQSYYSGLKLNLQDQAPHWRDFAWNPIQAGNYAEIHSLLLDSRVINSNTFYTKCTPMLWPMNNHPAEAIMEQWTTLNGNKIEVHCKIVCIRTDNIYGEEKYHGQELPALYPISSLKNLWYYKGDTPFDASSPLAPLLTPTIKTETNGWGQHYASENWMAFVDDSRWGMGVYAPNNPNINEGISGDNDGVFEGEHDTKETGYMAPVKLEKLKKNSVYEYDYYIIVDDLDNIRKEVIEIYNNAPSNLQADNINETLFVLSWTAAPNNNSPYEIFKDGEYIGSTSSTSFTVANLTHSQYYEMTVKQKNPITQVSSVSPPLLVNTLLAENTIINGSFEKPFSFDGTSSLSNDPVERIRPYKYLSNEHFSWNYSGNSGVTLSNTVFNDNINVPEAAQSAFLQTNAEISQVINFKKQEGRYISISFMAAQRRDNPNMIPVKIKVNDILIGEITPPSKDQYTLHTTAPFQVTDGSTKISFSIEPIGTNSNTILIDDININLYIQNETLNGTQDIKANNIHINSDAINSNEQGSVVIPNGANIKFNARNNVFINKDLKVIKGGVYKIK